MRTKWIMRDKVHIPMPRMETKKALTPGIYLALFHFEPEGTAEMALVEGQEVRVVGRGGGVRWVVVIREESNASTAGEAEEKRGEGVEEYVLVPESYLKFVKGDEEENELGCIYLHLSVAWI
ncbi:hypothetical protein M422DRAFT_268217 [Sphaerobolus stellatus SS14]|uniref:SH3 domain-containing protein n=1 Tax=Sphaerobolus stellatus (strain SS14) TaxID=990650 RepID=A0A0C9U7B3_SPHS4|nr:hypothetical protein M422DRAFT_268217 [Sphaerobolus stellatus SS14]